MSSAVENLKQFRILAENSQLMSFFSPFNAFCAFLVCLIVLTAVFAPFITSYDPNAIVLDEMLQPPSGRHLMGTDQFGRDILTRILFGARVSLLVGAGAIGLAVLLGVALGAVSGFKGGWLDTLSMRAVDLLLSIPGVILALAIIAVLEPGIANIIIALAVVRLGQFARVSRGLVLSVKSEDYVTSCRLAGLSSVRIVLRHVLPNISGPIVVLATIRFGNAILAEATLSFLGLGVQPPNPSWGGMIANGNEQLVYAPWISLFPGLFVCITMLAFNLLGDALRDHIDPRGVSV